MFGDQNQTCVLAAATAGIPTNTAPQGMRKIRDHFLLNTALGTALVDAYYSASPACVKWLYAHGQVFRLVRDAARAAEWMAIRLPLIALVGGGVLIAVLLAFLRRGVKTAVVIAVAALGLLACGGIVQAKSIQLTAKQLTDGAESIVAGEVSDVYSHWNETGNKIVTDVTVQVSDTLKGNVNKGAVLRIQQPGGRVGSVVTRVSDIPAFKSGEEVVLFLRDKPQGPDAYAGEQSKVLVVTDPATGQKRVQGIPKDAVRALAKTVQKSGTAAQPAATDDAAAEQVVTLDAFRRYVRQLVNEPVAK